MPTTDHDPVRVPDEIIVEDEQGTALALTAPGLAPQMHHAISLWANATTDGTSLRRRDLLRDKQQVLIAFFTFVGKPPAQVDQVDVAAWQTQLEARHLAPATVYAMISRVSSFYEWALTEPALRQHLHFNPVRLARPKAPTPYQSESTKALTIEDVTAIFMVIQTCFSDDDPMTRIIARRDYALFLWYMLSGLRRQEIMQLVWSKIKLPHDGSTVIETKIKGGRYAAIEIKDPSAQAALLHYLRYSGRYYHMQAKSPLWVAHDRGQATRVAKWRRERDREHAPRLPEQALSSHKFVERLKKYAARAGIHHIHLHQSRHTFAALVGEETGSFRAVQDALGHTDQRTSFIYAQRLGIKRDTVSPVIAARLGLPPLPSDADEW